MMRKLIAVIFLFAANASVARACMYETPIFFDKQSADLTEVAKGSIAMIIDQNAGFSRQVPERCNFVMKIEAHVDAAETIDQSQPLDLRRGEAIKNEAIRKGWPGEKILIIQVGTSKPKVKTLPNQSEPQNRYAGIRFVSNVLGERICKPYGSSCLSCYVPLPTGERCPQ